MEATAASLGFAPDRSSGYAGPGTELLGVTMAPPATEPQVRFIFANVSASHVRCDVYDNWSGGSATYDEYASAARTHIGGLLRQYRALGGENLRLTIGKRDPLWDWDQSTVVCSRHRYAKEKLAIAVESLTLGPGKIQERLASAFMSFHVLSAADFPGPLGDHMKWILAELTSKPSLYPQQGSLNATLGSMRKERAVAIAQRIVDLRDALANCAPRAWRSRDARRARTVAARRGARRKGMRHSGAYISPCSRLACFS